MSALDGSSVNAPKNDRVIPEDSFLVRVQKFVILNFLPLGFLFATVFAFSYPSLGRRATAIKLNQVGLIQALNSFLVFLISGVTLNISEAGRSLRRWHVLLIRNCMILFLTPILALVAIRLPLYPHEFAVGLAIFCTVPTTLGVGVALTTSCEGDQSVALLLTIMSNCLGIMTVPLAIQYFISTSSSISFNYGDVFTKLCITVLFPSLLGIALRARFKSVASFAKVHKVALSMFSTSNLVCIIWQTLSSASNILLQQPIQRIVIVAIASSLQHVFFLGVMYIITLRSCQLKATERVALIIMCAQKSAPVAVTVISYITSSSAQQGLLSVPALLGQLAQIFIGSFLVRYLKKLVLIERNNDAARTARADITPSTV